MTDLNPADLHLISHTTTDGVTTRELVLGDVTATLWAPEHAAPGTPLVLLGHGGGRQHRHHPAMTGPRPAAHRRRLPRPRARRRRPRPAAAHAGRRGGGRRPACGEEGGRADRADRRALQRRPRAAHRPRMARPARRPARRARDRRRARRLLGHHPRHRDRRAAGRRGTADPGRRLRPVLAVDADRGRAADHRPDRVRLCSGTTSTSRATAGLPCSTPSPRRRSRCTSTPASTWRCHASRRRQPSGSSSGTCAADAEEWRRLPSRAAAVALLPSPRAATYACARGRDGRDDAARGRRGGAGAVGFAGSTGSVSGLCATAFARAGLRAAARAGRPDLLPCGVGDAALPARRQGQRCAVPASSACRTGVIIPDCG